MEYQVTIQIPDSKVGIVPDMSKFANKLVLEALEREQARQIMQEENDPDEQASDAALRSPKIQQTILAINDTLKEIKSQK